MGRKPGSKTHIPTHEREDFTPLTAASTSASEIEKVKLQPGTKEKVLSDIARYLENPDLPMVKDGLVGRLSSTANMNIPPSKMYEDEGHKVDVLRFLSAKCATSLPPATPQELYASLDEFFSFCAQQRVPPTIGLFSVWNGVTMQRYNQIARDMRDPLRAEAFNNAKELIRGFLEIAALENDVNYLLYFHQNKTMYDLVENQQVTVRVEDNTRELSEDEREARMRSLESVDLVEDEDGTWHVP